MKTNDKAMFISKKYKKKYEEKKNNKEINIVLVFFMNQI